MGNLKMIKELNTFKNKSKNVFFSSKKTPVTKKTRGWLGGEGGPQTNLDKWYGPNRALYLPGGLLDRTDIPEYLTGELAGDYGYDPLELGKDGNVTKYREAELIHARWAMLGALGAIVPEALESFGNPSNGDYAVWWKTGAALLEDGPGTLKYGGITVPLPLVVIVAV